MGLQNKNENKFFVCLFYVLRQLAKEHGEQVSEKAGGMTISLRHCLLERFGSSEFKTS